MKVTDNTKTKTLSHIQTSKLSNIESPIKFSTSGKLHIGRNEENEAINDPETTCLSSSADPSLRLVVSPYQVKP